MPQSFDTLVLGGGIAGLSYALEASRYGSVAVLTKRSRAEGNTNYAQGGIAAVLSKDDSFEQHIDDTLVAGAGLCKREAVDVTVREGPARLKELIAWGAEFDRRNSGEFDLTREGGHTRRRVVHAGDITGAEVQRAMITACDDRAAICAFPDASAIDLVLDRHPPRVKTRSLGASVL